MVATRTVTGIDVDVVEHGPYRTHLARSGRGPVVLLLHGSGPGVSALANWQHTMTSELADQFTLIAPDIVGFGDTTSRKPGVPDHMERVRHVQSLARALKLRGVGIVGNSMGGSLALFLAAQAPLLVDRMVLMGPGGVTFPIHDAIEQLYGYQPSLAAMGRIFELMAYDRSLITPELVRMRYEATIAPGAQERYASLFPPPRQQHVDAQALPDAALARISTPTLIVHGAHDRVVPVTATSLRLVQLLPNADLLVLGRCGHWAQVERAEEFRRAVAEFLTRAQP